jgi:hypothetical protein
MTAYISLIDLSHDTELATALGNMVVIWAHAETIMIYALARISGTGVNMAQAGYYRIPTFEARSKFILALLPEWKTTEFDKDAIETAIVKLAKLASTRNHWVHGDWCISKDDKKVAVIFNHRAEMNSPERRKPVKANDVRQHCDAVRRRAGALANLIDPTMLPV